MSLTAASLTAWLIADPTEKVHAVQALWATHTQMVVLSSEHLEPPDSIKVPGHPEFPRLIPAKQVPNRTPFTPEGLASLIHAVCHIEFNAINLALDAVWRFNDMPHAYYTDWLSVATEESQHFELLHTHLKSLGYSYGDFDAHDGFGNGVIFCIDVEHAFESGFFAFLFILEINHVRFSALNESAVENFEAVI